MPTYFCHECEQEETEWWHPSLLAPVACWIIGVVLVRQGKEGAEMGTHLVAEGLCEQRNHFQSEAKRKGRPRGDQE